MKWGIPDKILSTKSADYIKKIFSIELLNEELQERIRIQKKLELLMAKYESTVLSCYDKLSYLKSSDTKTQEEYDVDIKIGMMHVALEKEGYEDIFYNQVRRGVTTQISAEEINELKRLSLMRQKIEEEVAYIQKPIPSLFETYGGAEFKISNYDKKFVSQKLERIRKYLEETNSEGVF
jgi:ribosome-associated translation inhibitor RaiA